jgi:Pyruvate/2-oxoacid:ferredoxin oxidoreductase delta subunit
MHSAVGKRHLRDYTDEELRKQADDLENAVTIPVNVEIRMDERVFDLSEVEKILKQAKKIIVQECGCRSDKKNCESPLEVCLVIDPAADYATKFAERHPREVSLKQALDVMRGSHEAGLVHMAYTKKGDDRATLICSCCPCCCTTLGGLLRHGIATHVLTSRFIAQENYEKCVDCGKCVDRCVFGARDLDTGKLTFDSSRCYGCGLYVSTCPTTAITLVPRG